MITEAHRQLSLTAEDAAALAAPLDGFVAGTSISAALLVDRSGQLLARSGSVDAIDLVTFATLACADFNANEQLAQLVGERDFRSLSHRGQSVSVVIEDVGGRALLVALVNKGVEIGLVRLAAQRASRELASALSEISQRIVTKHEDVPALLAGAEEEIDRMFDW